MAYIICGVCDGAGKAAYVSDQGIVRWSVCPVCAGTRLVNWRTEEWMLLDAEEFIDQRLVRAFGIGGLTRQKQMQLWLRANYG